jgi:hypothetical protein
VEVGPFVGADAADVAAVFGEEGLNQLTDHVLIDTLPHWCELRIQELRVSTLGETTHSHSNELTLVGRRPTVGEERKEFLLRHLCMHLAVLNLEQLQQKPDTVTSLAVIWEIMIQKWKWKIEYWNRFGIKMKWEM